MQTRPNDRTRSFPTRPTAIKSMLYLALTVAVLPAIGGCGPGGAIGVDLNPDVRKSNPQRTHTNIVMFLVDGLPPRMVASGCREGWLPNIRTRFWEHGAHVERATTCVPAITYASIATLLTGTGPGQHEIVGNRWFDPDDLLFRNYVTVRHYRDVNSDFDEPTLYELIAPAPSLSIQAAHHRGVTRNIANWAQSGVRWFFHNYTSVDKLTATTLGQAARWANTQESWPTAMMLYFPGADSVGHAYGASSAEFREALENVDHQIGRVCDWLQRQELLDNTYMVLVSDHGMVDIDPDGYIDLLHIVRDQWGRTATDHMLQDGPYEHRRRFFDRFNTVVAHQDGRRGLLYFRSASGWAESPAPETVEAILTAPPRQQRLWNIPGIDLVAYLASSDEVALHTSNGESRIAAREGPDGTEYAYFPQPEDALGYLATPELAAFVEAGFHESREWLRATADQTYPDLVPHLLPLLRVHRAGQVAVFTQPGYSFVHESGGHGGVRADERLMTFMLAGPGIAAGSVIDVARAVDLVPTLLDMLNIKVDADIWLEGESLLKVNSASRLPERAER